MAPIQQPPTRTVLYIDDPEQRPFVDRLPCNLGRQSTIHALLHAYHLLPPHPTPSSYPSSPSSPSSSSPSSSSPSSSSPSSSSPSSPSSSSPSSTPSHASRPANPIQSQHPEDGSEKEQGRKQRLVVPRIKKGTAGDLQAFHSTSYVAALLRPTAIHPPSPPSTHTSHHEKLEGDTVYGLEYDNPRFDGLPEYVLSLAGAARTIADILLIPQNSSAGHCALCRRRSGDTQQGQQGRREAQVVVLHPAGGRHHARKARAVGFCYVADLVLLVQSLLPCSLPPSVGRKGRGKHRIMVLDTDLHFGDGTAAAFKLNPSVLTLSIHHASPGFFPTSASTEITQPSADGSDSSSYDLQVPLKIGAGQDTFGALLPAVRTIMDAFDPHVLIHVAGTDTLPSDPHATFNWPLFSDPPGRREGKGQAEFLAEVLSWDRPTIVLGAGGYDHPSVAKAWTTFAHVALSRPISSDSPLTDTLPDDQMELYRPPYDLGVRASLRPDTNSAADLAGTVGVLEEHARRIRRRRSSGS